MEANEKRETRTYKTKATPYFNAMKHATSQGSTLTNVIEDFVVGYASGDKRVTSTVSYIIKKHKNEKPK